MSIESPTGHNVHARLKASLLGVVGSFVLFAAYLAIPPLGVFSGILAPFPAAYNRLHYGRVSAFIVIFGTTALITALFGIFAGCLYLGMCGVIGFLLPELLLLGVSGSRTLFWTTVANLALFSAGFVAYSSFSGVNLQGVITAEISNSLKQAVSLYEKSGVTGEELELLKSSMATAAEMLQRLYPALVTVMLVLISGCNLALLRKSAIKIRLEPPIGEFSKFKNPDLLVWLLIAVGSALLLPASQITTPALNILLIIILLYFIQGIAVVNVLISKHSVSSLLRIFLYVMLVIQPYLLIFIAGIGLFDLWVDFRTPKKQENL